MEIPMKLQITKNVSKERRTKIYHKTGISDEEGRSNGKFKA